MLRVLAILAIGFGVARSAPGTCTVDPVTGHVIQQQDVFVDQFGRTIVAQPQFSQFSSFGQQQQVFRQRQQQQFFVLQDGTIVNQFGQVVRGPRRQFVQQPRRVFVRRGIFGGANVAVGNTRVNVGRFGRTRVVVGDNRVFVNPQRGRVFVRF